MLVSITRIRLRIPLFLPAFLWQSYKSIVRARKFPGNMGARFRKSKGLAFWTLTAWKDEPSMKAFRNTPPHLNVTSRLMFWCDESSFAYWEQEPGELPPWDEAARKLAAQGKLSKLNYPSERQKTVQISNN